MAEQDMQMSPQMRRDEEHIRLAEANRESGYVDLAHKTRQAKHEERKLPVYKPKLGGA